VSVDAQRAAAEALHGWAHEYADGRWVALGGGGYAVFDVVPRTWTHLVGIAAGAPVPPDTEVPASWRESVYARTGSPVAPQRMTDGREPVCRMWSEGYDPADPLDRAVQATRKAVFPAHGLLP
jgi:acetoin utilization protein AcuC